MRESGWQKRWSSKSQAARSEYHSIISCILASPVTNGPIPSISQRPGRWMRTGVDEGRLQGEAVRLIQFYEVQSLRFCGDGFFFVSTGDLGPNLQLLEVTQKQQSVSKPTADTNYRGWGIWGKLYGCEIWFLSLAAKLTMPNHLRLQLWEASPTVTSVSLLASERDVGRHRHCL